MQHTVFPMVVAYFVVAHTFIFALFHFLVMMVFALHDTMRMNTAMMNMCYCYGGFGLSGKQAY
ncbi:MAG: hypothetical protein IJB31_04150 [Akkermansia sp.]|nr:hypothetical protein [Akkermansia sp.]